MGISHVGPAAAVPGSGVTYVLHPTNLGKVVPSKYDIFIEDLSGNSVFFFGIVGKP